MPGSVPCFGRNRPFLTKAIASEFFPSFGINPNDSVSPGSHSSYVDFTGRIPPWKSDSFRFADDTPVIMPSSESGLRAA